MNVYLFFPTCFLSFLLYLHREEPYMWAMSLQATSVSKKVWGRSVKIKKVECLTLYLPKKPSKLDCPFS